jgi:uncharacterized protein (TIRG00374 family)
MVTTVLPRQTDEVASAEAPSSSRRSSWLPMALKIGLSGLAIGMVLKTVDLSAAWQHVLDQNLWFLLVAAAAMLVQTALGGLRWHVILAQLGGKGRVLDSLRLFYISAFFNTWMWGSVGGDMVRAWLSYRAQASAATSISSVILDRVASVAGVAILVLMTMPMFVDRVGPTISVLVPAAISAAGLAGIVVVGHLHRLPLDWQRNRLLKAIGTLSSATRVVFLRPRSALLALGLAVAAQTAMAVSAYAVAMSLGLGLTLLDCLVLFQPVALIAALPISIGGWGVREAAVVAVLGIVGVAPSAALVLSLQIGLLAILVTLPASALWLVVKLNDKPSGSAS